MKLTNLRDKQWRARHSTRAIKTLKRFANKRVHSTPVFVFGRQRSGTGMLMLCFELHSKTEVFSEARESRAFKDFRIRDYQTLKELIYASKAPYIVFKPISDSHLINEFVEHFPHGKFLWVYRNYKDVANSALRKWSHATRAIKLVCTNQQGGGWFQEGISSETASILREIYTPSLSEFDLACLVWWARNRIFVEQRLDELDNLILIRYEDIAENPKSAIPAIYKFLGLKFEVDSIRYIHNKSINKNPYPNLNPSIKDICEELLDTLDASLRRPNFLIQGQSREKV